MSIIHASRRDNSGAASLITNTQRSQVSVVVMTDSTGSLGCRARPDDRRNKHTVVSLTASEKSKLREGGGVITASSSLPYTETTFLPNQVPSEEES